MHQHIAGGVRRANFNQVNRTAAHVQLGLATEGAGRRAFLHAGKIERRKHLGEIATGHPHLPGRACRLQLRQQCR